MKKLFLIFIINIIIFSCKTSYNKDYALQCNQNQVATDINKIKKEKAEYIDSIYNHAIVINKIDVFTTFIKTFPESQYINDIKSRRQKLFKIKAEVEKSVYNIDYLINKNPCYIPIYKNIDYIRDTNIQFESLYNTVLESTNPYRNRFIVANLNTITENGKSIGVNEHFFDIEKGWEFQQLFKFSKKNNITIDSLLYIDPSVFLLQNEFDTKILERELRLYKNYYNKVGKYQKEEIQKKYSSYNGYRYAGQKLCFCEIDKDTILLIAEHVTSGRGKTRHTISEDSITGEKTFQYSEAMPIGKQRKYYAAENKITIRNWETQRKYDRDDELRDNLMGGGNARVTYFDGKSQLPNFMLIDPNPKYPGAMKMNGIHEGSLTNMSRCMLGTPQSLGCFRTTDYGSKFCRWWIPKYSNFYIYYEEEKYTNKEIPNEEMDGIRLPFKNKKEGNLFRKWVNKKYPSYAKEIDLEEEGSCSNCFIQLAWEKYYHEYMKTKEGKKLDFTLPDTISVSDNILEKKVERIEEKNIQAKNKIDLTRFDIIQEHYIIIGCFNQIKNATAYGNRFKKMDYPISIFYNNSAQCNFVSIGPYVEKQQAVSDLPSIQKNIEKEAWIYIKVAN
tara:strand:+ start:867 stop:2711 length:1845 start_codon:yes stop_codon:yes gene_type:complete